MILGLEKQLLIKNMEAKNDECLVCRDTYSARIRKPVGCPYCQFVCCMNCFKQYLLSLASEPACMSCKVQFSYEFLIEKLPPTFWHREYKNFRKNILLSREESLLPETQSCIIRIKRKEAFYKHIKSFKTELDKMFQHYNKLIGRMSHMSEMVHQERTGQIEIPDDHPYFLYFHDDNTPMKNENGELLCMMEDPGVEIANKRIKTRVHSGWVCPCPKENCRGYLRGDQTVCPICGTHVCKDCIQAVPENEETHECKKEDVETVNMLRQNTKPCPNCSIPIYKISGCDQMWCTQCRTPFSWSTGLKINQRIHNPHYYEWMQRHQGEDMPRELMDIPCGGLPSIHTLRKFPHNYQEWIYTLHQNILHYEHVIIPRHQNAQPDEVCKSLRISYLLNFISKDYWRDELYRTEKAHQKHQQYLQVIQTFVAVATEWLRRMVIEMPSNLDQEVKNTIGFFHYINNQIMFINNRFKCNLGVLPDALLHV